MQLVTRNQFSTYFGPDLASVVTINPGEQVVIETRTGPNVYPLERTLERLDMNKAMPLSGPIRILGAQPGELLEVKITNIQVADYGVSLVDPRFGILKEETDDKFIRVTPIKDNYVEFNNDIKIPINPMIGCIATAPPEERERGNPGDYGANLDLVEIKAGNVIYLPVFIEGANLVLGNVHAVMGEGVITGLGLEIESAVTLHVNIIKDSYLQHPLIETPTHIIIPGYGNPIEEAIRNASRRSIIYLTRCLKLERVEAYSLISLTCDVHLGSIVNEITSAAVYIPKNILPSHLTYII